MLIVNNEDIDDITTLTPVTIDPSILPSKPIIEQAVYAFESLFIKWSLHENGGSDINQITIYILNYGNSGITNTISLGNYLRIYDKNIRQYKFFHYYLFCE